MRTGITLNLSPSTARNNFHPHCRLAYRPSPSPSPSCSSLTIVPRNPPQPATSPLHLHRTFCIATLQHADHCTAIAALRSTSTSHASPSPPLLLHLTSQPSSSQAGALANPRSRWWRCKWTNWRWCSQIDSGNVVD